MEETSIDFEIDGLVIELDESKSDDPTLVMVSGTQGQVTVDCLYPVFGDMLSLNGAQISPRPQFYNFKFGAIPISRSGTTISANLPILSEVQSAGLGIGRDPSWMSF